MTESGPKVVDFDHHSPEFARDWDRQWADLRQCPVAWSERHGGFWVVSGHAQVVEVSRDDVTYSSEHDIDGTGRGPEYQGITLPNNPALKAGLIEMDPPEFRKHRTMLNVPFAPAAIAEYEDDIRTYTARCLDQILADGAGDLVLDLANPVPAMLTVKMLGLPFADWRRFAAAYHDEVSTPRNTPEFERVVKEIMWTIEQVAITVQQRKQEPRDDLISYMVHTPIDGEPMGDQLVLENCVLMMAGGMDTTTAVLADAALYLYRNPDERRRLIDDPGLVPTAIEEFLRFFSPVQALARTVACDTTLSGLQLREGQRLLLSWASANRDETVFDRADEILMDRKPNRHAAFGLGAHRCLGSHLARLEIAIVLGELLRRVSDYRILEDQAQRYETIGVVNGWSTMPMRTT